MATQIFRAFQYASVQEWDDVDIHLVEQPCREVLLDDAAASAEGIRS